MLSVLNQNYPNLEYIVIDGGSNDGSIDIIKKHASRITYWISEKDEGQSDALNKGLQMASGEVVGWLNSDDCYINHCLHEVGHFFLKHSETDILYGDVVNFDSKGNEKIIRNHFEMKDFFSRVSLHQPGIFWRRSLHKQIGFIDKSLHYCMDYDLWMRLFLNFKSERLDKTVAKFREHSDSKTHNNPLQQYREYQLVVSRFFISVNGGEWKEKINKLFPSNQEQLFYFIKIKYSNDLISELFDIYLLACLEIYYREKKWAAINLLFFKYPKLLLSKKGLVTFLKTNSLFIFIRSDQ